MMVTSKKVRKALLLDIKGILLALVIGAVLVFMNPIYLVILLVFLFLGVTVTRYEYAIKKQMGIYEHERGWQNVLANGLVPVIGALISPFAFLGAVAAVSADKFASEMGVLGEKPIELFTFKRVEQGKSGAVSPFGTFMSFVGALAIAVVAIFLLGITLPQALIIAIIGFIGSVGDSLLGVPEELGYGNKMTTNILCSIIGLILSVIVFGI